MREFKRYINIEPPTKEKLTFDDGAALSEELISPNMDDLVNGSASIRFLVPAERKMPNHDGRNNLEASFFTGLVIPLLTELRDQHYPDLEQSVKRSKIRSVDTLETKDAIEAFRKIMSETSQSYDRIEDLFWDRLQLGFKYNSGEIKMGVMNTDREFTFPDSTQEEENRLFFWSYKLSKALSSGFVSNLQENENDPPQSLNSENPEP